MAGQRAERLDHIDLRIENLVAGARRPTPLSLILKIPGIQEDFRAIRLHGNVFGIPMALSRGVSMTPRAIWWLPQKDGASGEPRP